MSYRFGMMFKQCESFEEAFRIATKVSRLSLSNANEIIENNLHLVPSVRQGKASEAYCPSNEDLYWLQSIFNCQFTYWPEYNLLGLFGDEWPDEIANLFDTHFYFQNSCNQDYDYDQWSDSISVFAMLKSVVQSIPDNLLHDAFLTADKDMFEDYSEEEMQASPDYFRKNLLYKMVFGDLSLDERVENKECEDYEAFNLNPVCDADTRMMVGIYNLTKVVREMAALEKKYCKKSNEKQSANVSTEEAKDDNSKTEDCERE